VIIHGGTSFCRALLCINKRGRCCRAVSVTFVYCVETAKDTAGTRVVLGAILKTLAF